MNRKGIILAGGIASRLYPITIAVSKQLLPIYNKPMIYYPLSTLMMAGIRDILIITKSSDLNLFKELLGDGAQWGISISYIIQPNPDGLAQAFILAEDFIGDDLSTLILGDNILYGHDLRKLLLSSSEITHGATIFAYRVNDPERYGVVEFDSKDKVISIEEKPKEPKSNYAVAGLYFYDNKVVKYAKDIKPSKRGELEITDLNKKYLDSNTLYTKLLTRGYCWLDVGTFDSLIEASKFIATVEKRQGLMIGLPEEVAYRNKWITKNCLNFFLSKNKSTEYLKYINNLLNND